MYGGYSVVGQTAATRGSTHMVGRAGVGVGVGVGVAPDVRIAIRTAVTSVSEC